MTNPRDGTRSDERRARGMGARWGVLSVFRRAITANVSRTVAGFGTELSRTRDFTRTTDAGGEPGVCVGRENLADHHDRCTTMGGIGFVEKKRRKPEGRMVVEIGLKKTRRTKILRRLRRLVDTTNEPVRKSHAAILNRTRGGGRPVQRVLERRRAARRSPSPSDRWLSLTAAGIVPFHPVTHAPRIADTRSPRQDVTRQTQQSGRYRTCADFVYLIHAKQNLQQLQHSKLTWTTKRT